MDEYTPSFDYILVKYARKFTTIFPLFDPEAIFKTQWITVTKVYTRIVIFLDYTMTFYCWRIIIVDIDVISISIIGVVKVLLG